MPMPVSDTANASVTASVPICFVSTVTVTDPADVNFTALPTRLVRICRIATGSPLSAGGTLSAIDERIVRPFSRAAASNVDTTSSNDRLQRERRLNQREGARFRLAQFEHVVEQVEHVLGRRLEQPHEPALRLRQVAAIEQLHDAHQRVQRVADVMTEHRQEVCLVLRDLLGLAPGQQQLSFVPAPVGRVEQRDPVEQRRAVGVALLA